MRIVEKQTAVAFQKKLTYRTRRLTLLVRFLLKLCSFVRNKEILS